MTRLTQYDRPTRIDDLFRNLFLQPTSMLGKYVDLSIRADVSEDDKAYTIKADIPGVKKEDIDVKINGNQLFIHAEVKQEKVQKKEERVVQSERYYGEVSRSFTFDQDINAAGAEAKYDDGVLQLTLPKASGSALKQLKIK